MIENANIEVKRVSCRIKGSGARRSHLSFSLSGFALGRRMYQVKNS